MLLRSCCAIALLMPPLAIAQAAHTPQSGAGRKVYDYFCYQCHGYNGDARTVAAQSLAVRPRDFTTTRPEALSREQMLRTVRHGKPRSPMRGFGRVLSDAEIEAVVDYVRGTFMQPRRTAHRYHTEANGWRDHDRHRDAFPFATGEVPIDTPWEALSRNQRAGRSVFLQACVTCHEPVRRSPSRAWKADAVTYPKNPETCDGCHDSSRHLHAGAAVPGAERPPRAFGAHARPPAVRLTPEARSGQKVFLENCAFCHAADGTGANWIGGFLDPPPRNLVAPGFLDAVDDALLRKRIREGLPGTAMPAWGEVLDDGQIGAVVRYLREVVAQHPATGTGAAVAPGTGPGPATATPARLGWRRAPAP